MAFRGDGGPAGEPVPGGTVLAEGRAAFGWRWQITTTHLRTGRLGWPLRHRARTVPLAAVGSVQVANGSGRLRDDLHVGAAEGRVNGGHHGAVIAYLDEPVAAHTRIVIGTATVQDAKDLGRLLGDQVDVARKRAGQPPRPLPAERSAGDPADPVPR